MNELKLTEKTIDSREVAVMMNMEHKELLRKIKTHIGYMEKENAERKNALGDYFKETTYIDANNQERPCYQVTRKGCELLAHKMTGQKGTKFTVAYIERFHQMEGYINNDKAIKQLLISMESRMDEIVQKKIEALEAKNSEYYRPTHKHKLSLTNYIKKRMDPCTDEEIQLVKERVMLVLNADKWEDVPKDKLLGSINLIDESIRVIKADRSNQITFWD